MFFFKRISNKRCNLLTKRPCLYPELEQALYAFVISIRSKGGCVGIVSLRAKAQELAKQLQLEKFNVSNGWLIKFLERK